MFPVPFLALPFRRDSRAVSHLFLILLFLLNVQFQVSGRSSPFKDNMLYRVFKGTFTGTPLLFEWFCRMCGYTLIWTADIIPWEQGRLSSLSFILKQGCSELNSQGYFRVKWVNRRDSVPSLVHSTWSAQLVFLAIIVVVIILWVVTRKDAFSGPSCVKDPGRRKVWVSVLDSPLLAHVFLPDSIWAWQTATISRNAFFKKYSDIFSSEAKGFSKSS